MKKALSIGLLFLLVSSVFADTAYRDLCRKILYGVKPVEAIGQLDEAAFQNLRRYSLGLPVEGQEPLNKDDERLMFFLYACEYSRRTKTRDEFSLYLQESRERLAEYIKQGDILSIKMDGWIDLFRLNLMFAN